MTSSLKILSKNVCLTGDATKSTTTEILIPVTKRYDTTASETFDLTVDATKMTSIEISSTDPSNARRNDGGKKR